MTSFMTEKGSHWFSELQSTVDWQLLSPSAPAQSGEVMETFRPQALVLRNNRSLGRIMKSRKEGGAVARLNQAAYSLHFGGMNREK
jgi:hypothetical protein